ncbi:MAG: hypothetical protein IT464_10105 [Planctomycetes bacterium]|nr:hypothetical protein [Planctomycetota bacterium]
MSDEPKASGVSTRALIAWLVGAAVLVAIVAVDYTVHHHAHFTADGIDVDAMPEFFPLFGLVSGFVLVLLSKTLSIALKRKDTFYADD